MNIDVKNTACTGLGCPHKSVCKLYLNFGNVKNCISPKPCCNYYIIYGSVDKNGVNNFSDTYNIHDLFTIFGMNKKG
jgi:hypothetical protein